MSNLYRICLYFVFFLVLCIAFFVSIYIIRVAEQWESLCSQAKILNLHLRLILKNTSGKISWSHTNYMRLRHQKHGSWIIFFKEKLTHVKPLPQSIYIYLTCIIFAWINFCECRPRKISRGLIFANGQA